MLTQQQTLRWIALPLLLATFSGAQNKILWARDELPLSSEGLAHRISRLIEQLGDDRYTTRERAQAELAKLGFEAFEALSEAQSHQEIEIAQRAKYLILSMRINWTWDEDPPAVKTILKGYEQQGNDRRVMSMNALAQLEDGQGIEALCRLARFERTDELSKQAAMLVIANAPREKKERVRHRTTIRTTLGPSKRPGTLWLRVYADWLHEPAATSDNCFKSIRNGQVQGSYVTCCGVKPKCCATVSARSWLWQCRDACSNTWMPTIRFSCWKSPIGWSNSVRGT